MSDSVDYTWEAAALQRTPNQDCCEDSTLNLCSEDGSIILDFSSLKFIDGEKITITGDYDLINRIKNYISLTRNVVDGYIVKVVENEMYFTFGLDEEDNVVATLHLKFNYEKEKWVEFLEKEMHQINAPGNFYWVGSNFYQEP